MDASAVERAIALGEGAQTEFKRCGSRPGRDVLETVCAFANRFGGNIFLGVTDSGGIEGVGARALEVERAIANAVSDPGLFRPQPAVETEAVDVGGATVVRVWVPSGPEVYRLKGEVYDRIADADVRVSSTSRITAIGIRKQQIYTEQHVFPGLGLPDLRPDLISRARGLASSARAGHPWAGMGDAELLRSARLWRKDPETGEEGPTRAAVLLLGTDDAILSVSPAHRFDAVWGPDPSARYADRETLATNLVETRDALLGFCRRHTDDPFFLDGARAVSVRDLVCRELVTNMVVHREYLSPMPARLSIGPEGIRTENASRAAFDGPVTPAGLSPVPKNPAISGFFRQMGYAEELGSGVRALWRYSRHFMGADPELEEGDVFRALIPDARSGGRQGGGRVEAAILALVDSAGFATSAEAARIAGVTQRTASGRLRKLVDEGVLAAVGSTTSRRYVRA